MYCIKYLFQDEIETYSSTLCRTLTPSKYDNYGLFTWVGKGVTCIDVEISCNRVTRFDHLFPLEKLIEVNVEFEVFCIPSSYISNLHVMEDMNASDPLA